MRTILERESVFQQPVKGVEMKKQISVALLIAMMSFSVFAEWIAVQSDGQSTYYFDPATTSKTGTKATMRELIDYKKTTISAPGKTYFPPYKSIVVQSEYDCKRRQFRPINVTSYSGNMGGGDAYLESPNVEWQAVLTGSAADDTWKVACAGVKTTLSRTPLPEKIKTEFIKSGIQTCLVKQHQDPLAKYMTEPELNEYCYCSMNRATDFITLEEVGLAMRTKNIEHLRPAMEKAGNYCTQMMMKKWGHIK